MDYDCVNGQHDAASIPVIEVSNLLSFGGAGPSSIEPPAVNTASVVTSVVLSPSAPVTSDALSCIPTVFDAEGDALSFVYRWKVSGVTVPGAASNSLPLSFHSGDDQAQREARPFDGVLLGAFAASTRW